MNKSTSLSARIQGIFIETQLQNDRRSRHLQTKHTLILSPSISFRLFFSSHSFQFISFPKRTYIKCSTQNQNATQNLFLLPHWNILLYFLVLFLPVLFNFVLFSLFSFCYACLLTDEEKKKVQNQMKKILYKYMQFIDEIICMVNNEMVVAIVSLIVCLGYKICYMQKCKKLNFELYYIRDRCELLHFTEMLTNAFYVYEFFFTSSSIFVWYKVAIVSKPEKKNQVRIII